MSESDLPNIINNLFKIKTDNYIFIYTPPKVGSTTLVTSLRISLGMSFNVVHIHDEIMLNVLTGLTNIKINDIIHFLSNQGKNVYVIDVYRSPIERKMSAFFEKISPLHFNNTEENISKYSIKRLSDRFNKLFPYLENGDHYFDKYAIENPINFDFLNKYTIQELNNIKYIKLRLCDSYLWGSILTNILKNEIIIISDYNTESKCIGYIYNKFKEEYKIPINYLENIKKCKYFNYYYNEEERNKYLNMWSSNQTDAYIPYNEEEYKFYINLCLENQYIYDIQTQHYIDNGCFCKYCNKKRRELFLKAKSGEKITDRIIHIDVVNENINKSIQKISNVVKNKCKLLKSNSKFSTDQFKLKLK